MDPALEGLILEVEEEIRANFPEVKYLGYFERADASVVVEVSASGTDSEEGDTEEIEDALNEKCQDIFADSGYEVVVHVIGKEGLEDRSLA